MANSEFAPVAPSEMQAHVLLNLAHAYAAFIRGHETNGSEPVEQAHIGIFKDRTDEMQKPIGSALSAVGTFPPEFHAGERIDFRATAAGTTYALRPTALDKELVASLFVRGARPRIERLASRAPASASCRPCHCSSSDGFIISYRRFISPTLQLQRDHQQHRKEDSLPRKSLNSVRALGQPATNPHGPPKSGT